jgi:tubulin-specific chaperone A
MTDIHIVRRQLKIKSGAVQRLHKETRLYRKEAEDLEKKKTRLITEGAEEWDIKNATKMIEESMKMVDDTTGRLDKAVDELETLVTSANKEGELSQDEDFLKAEKILQEAKG